LPNRIWQKGVPVSYIKIKRAMDVILSVGALLISFPILLFIAVAIKVESKGPVLFKQERLGLHGKIFSIYKFRSMCVGAEKGGVYEKKNDSRVTKIGRFIRKTSIDELPQLFNIIKGDMSLIGPRPTLTYHPWGLENYSKEQRRRFELRPGITGWAQIHGRKEISWEQRIKYDVEYVERISFRFDAKIFLLTIIKVIAMKDNVNIGETTQKKDVDA
jgi:lipopolysaccharide/colanic/teichoic acid biosynthesis glycosyltransferase